MFKTILNMLAGALIVAGISAAYAVTGIAPHDGFQSIDGLWLKGIAGGQNYTYQYNISAAGTTQATATVLPTNIFLIEVDTVASGTGVNLPTCIPGTQMQIYNNGANSLTIFPAVANNPATGAQDTINNATSIALASHAAISPACAKAGVWFAS